MRKLLHRLKDESGMAVYMIIIGFVIVGGVLIGMIVDRSKFASVEKQTKYAMQDSLAAALQTVNQQELAHGIVQIDSTAALQAFAEQFASDLNMSYTISGSSVTFAPNDKQLFNGGNVTLDQFIIYNPGSYPTNLPDGLSGQVTQPSIFAKMSVPIKLPVDFEGGKVYTEQPYLLGATHIIEGSGPGSTTSSLSWTEMGYNDSNWSTDTDLGKVFSAPWWPLTSPASFPDPNAHWLWPVAPASGSQYDNPKTQQGNTYHRKVFTMPYTGTLQIAYDTYNTATLYVDGQVVGSDLTAPNGTSTKYADVHLSAGTHVLAIEANQFQQGNVDTSSVGGVVVAAYLNGSLVFDSQADGTWKTSGYTTP